MRSGNLSVVVLDDGAPFISSVDGSYQGLAMVFADAVRQELEAFIGKPISIVPYPVNSVKAGVEALISGNAEMACGVAYTWERSLLVDYTLPFAVGGVRVLAPSTIDGTPGSLSGQRVGVVRDTHASSVLQAGAPEATFVSYDSGDEAFAALRSGQVQVLGGDSLWLKSNQAENAPSAQIVPELPYGRASIACVIPENNSTLLNYSNIGITKQLQSYINDDPDARNRIDRWIGPGSDVDLAPEVISEFFGKVITTASPISTP
jgi:polar amino acid transport system substrate-binding protein